MRKVRDLWRRLSAKTRNAIIAGRNVAAWTFIVAFGGSALGWMQEVISWADASGQEPFPDVSMLGFAAISAVGAAATGALAAVVRWAQASLGRGNPPNYD